MGKKFFDLKNNAETAQYTWVTVPLFKCIDNLCIKSAEEKFMIFSQAIIVTQMENLCNTDYIRFIPDIDQSFFLERKAPSFA